jgi:4-hydroxy-tetrahydrodipicolinate synthase
MKLYGVVPPIGTPLTADDQVDVAGLRRLAAYLLEGGVHALLANGTMGGFAFLTDDQQIRSIETTVEVVSRRIPVIGGLGETSTARAVAMAKRIETAGVDAISTLPPFYYFATQDHLIAYFSEIAAAVDLPLFLYDNPVMTKNHIRPETVAILRSQIPRMSGIKVSNQDFVNLQTLIELMRVDVEFSIFTGSEFLIFAALQTGCHGCVGGLHNICPRIAVELYDAFRAGDLATARQRQQTLIKAWQIFKYGDIWGAFDEALRWLGICDGATAAPYRTILSENDRASVRAILEEHVRSSVARHRAGSVPGFMKTRGFALDV